MAPTDHLDLSISPVRKTGNKLVNPAVKLLLLNYTWRENLYGLLPFYPIIIAGQELAKGLSFGVQKRAKLIADNLEQAMSAAIEMTGTDKIIVFDGSFGSINLSPSMRDFLLSRAPDISRKVDEHYLPLWLSQRGIDPKEI
jgi:hypothetical protein